MTPWQYRLTTNIIRRGGIIAYPTEAVFGLGCDPVNFRAVEEICRLKRRNLSKGLILIASHIDQVRAYVSATPAQLKKLAKTTTSPVTWIMPAQAECPTWLTGNHHSIAVRITRHPIAKTLCQQLGHALVSTSANISRQPAARTALDVQRIFGDELDMIIHADTGDSRRPSEIRDITSGKTLRPS